MIAICATFWGWGGFKVGRKKSASVARWKSTSYAHGAPRLGVSRWKSVSYKCGPPTTKIIPVNQKAENAENFSLERKQKTSCKIDPSAIPFAHAEVHHSPQGEVHPLRHASLQRFHHQGKEARKIHCCFHKFRRCGCGLSVKKRSREHSEKKV